MLYEIKMPYMAEADDLGGDMPNAEVAAQEEAPAIEDTTQPQVTEQPKLRINYMGEEKEIDLEEAKTLAQKGMNYDPIQQKWEQAKTRLSKFEEIARKAGFVDANGHGDVEAYQTAADEQLKAMEIEKLTQGMELPKELAEELYLSRKERAERQAEAERQKAEKQKQEEYAELLAYYKDVHGKDLDPATTTLPKEVWEAVNNGVRPKYAYAEYLSKQLAKERMIEQANAENAQASVGSLTNKNATADNEFFTETELDKLTPHDLNDPGILAKAVRSISKIGR